MTDTIAAVATAMTASGIGIIRMSGPDSRKIAGKVYRSKGGKKRIEEVSSHTINYGFICDGEETIDEVLVMVMDGPRSYTGEDTVEIDCHGGVLAMKRVLETVEVRGQTGGAGRVYKEGLFKRQNGFVPGGSRH